VIAVEKSRPSMWCPHGFLKIPGADIATGCPRCTPRAPLKPADPCKLSSLPPETKTARCLECGLVVERTKWHTWRPKRRQPRIACCPKGQHRWQPAADGERQDVRVYGADADGEPRQGEDRDCGGEQDHGGGGLP